MANYADDLATIDEYVELHGQHDGPCLNYGGQDPQHYDRYDSCELHMQASERRRAAARESLRRLKAVLDV